MSNTYNYLEYDKEPRLRYNPKLTAVRMSEHTATETSSSSSIENETFPEKITKTHLGGNRRGGPCPVKAPLHPKTPNGNTAIQHEELRLDVDCNDDDDDDDDDDDEKREKKSRPAQRPTPPRRNKGVRKQHGRHDKENEEESIVLTWHPRPTRRRRRRHHHRHRVWTTVATTPERRELDQPEADSADDLPAVSATQSLLSCLQLPMSAP